MAKRQAPPDDVLLNKAAIIERTLSRISEDYLGHEGALELGSSPASVPGRPTSSSE